LAVTAFGLIAVGAVRQLRQTSERLTRYAVIALVILPFAIAYGGVLIVHRDFTHAQYHITSLPLVLLFTIKGIQGLGRTRVLQASAVVLYSLVIGISLFHYYFDTQHYGRRVDWHLATRQIERLTSPSEPLLLLAKGEVEKGDYPYLDRYAYHTRPAWLGIALPMDTISQEDYTDYLRQRLASYHTVYYLWEATTKDICDPRNVVIKSFRSLGAAESEDVIAPRLSIYRWSLPVATDSR
jgi:hypothetical protein